MISCYIFRDNTGNWNVNINMYEMSLRHTCCFPVLVIGLGGWLGINKSAGVLCWAMIINPYAAGGLNLADTKWHKKFSRMHDWNPGIWVLTWESSARAIQWIPTWQGFQCFSLKRCVLVLWMKMASALDRLKCSLSQVLSEQRLCLRVFSKGRGGKDQMLIYLF